MNEGDHLYGLVTEAASPEAVVAGFNQQELVKLINHAEHLIKRNGSNGGVPSLVVGLCTLEAADRYRNQIL